MTMYTENCAELLLQNVRSSLKTNFFKACFLDQRFLS